MPEKNIPQMETIDKSAKIAGLPKHYVRQLVLQRKIKFVKAGKKYLVNMDSLAEYLNTGDNETQEANITNIRKVKV